MRFHLGQEPSDVTRQCSKTQLVQLVSHTSITMADQLTIMSDKAHSSTHHKPLLKYILYKVLGKAVPHGNRKLWSPNPEPYFSEDEIIADMFVEKATPDELYGLLDSILKSHYKYEFTSGGGLSNACNHFNSGGDNGIANQATV